MTTYLTPPKDIVADLKQDNARLLTALETMLTYFESSRTEHNFHALLMANNALDMSYMFAKHRE